MGVHYFMTWVASRYPMIKQPLASKSLPEVDHLYMDLNGVLYLCSKDSSAVFKDILQGKRFEEIFSSTLNYLNFIVNSVRPKRRYQIWSLLSLYCDRFLGLIPFLDLEI